ncbi:hypothetical protein GQ55_2G232500 [Panicum hallii var. hallii]|uniref:Uncharacterized protein n=1 Tax=Panicum hallii var. hallii TaxID=1504633 RepID=A0A2T7ERL1_9POAL|nr:hypothetical protein GQ55_2G232500 [Panicum hallii var. hallii]
MALCSGFLDGFHSLLNKLSKNDENDETLGSCSTQASPLFPNAGRALGNPRSYVLRGLAKVQEYRYVLFNFLIAHAEEITTKHNGRRVSHRDVEKIQNKKFHQWFRGYVSATPHILYI